jgi:hypothetical protein
MTAASPRLAGPKARRWALAVVSLGGVALVTACGSNITGGTAGSSASVSATAGGSAAASRAAVQCAQLEALGTALTKFGHAAVSLESVGQLAADLANVEQQLTKLKDLTALAFSAQETQLTAAVDEINKDVVALASHPSDANLNALAAAVNNLKAAAKPVIKKIDATCPAS